MEGQTSVPPPGTPGGGERQPKWRRDFPIDQPQDNYVARRDFTKFLVLISGAFAVGQMSIAIRNYFRRRRGLAPIQRIADRDELPVGAAMAFNYPDRDPCLLLRLGEDEFVAYQSQCTHLMCPVQPEVQAARLHCPCHAGYFDIRTGRPIAGPPRRPLPRVTLAVRRGTIYATGLEMEPR